MGRHLTVAMVLLAILLGIAAMRRDGSQAAGAPTPPAAGSPGDPWDPDGAGEGLRLYVVQPGDTLFSIARRFGTTVTTLQDLNAIDDPNLIAAGQVLRVPAADETLPALAPAKPPSRTPPVAPDERGLLAAIIWLEARGEPFEGQVAVGAVVLNRVRDSAFPDSIAGVLLQPGQFPFTLEMLLSASPGPEAYAAADLALQGVDPTGGALYFYNPAKTTTPEFWAARPALVRIGSHVFTR